MENAHGRGQAVPFFVQAVPFFSSLFSSFFLLFLLSSLLLLRTTSEQEAKLKLKHARRIDVGESGDCVGRCTDRH